jgi:hypothetical protein
MKKPVDAKGNRYGDRGDGVALNLSRPKSALVPVRLDASAVTFGEVRRGIHKRLVQSVPCPPRGPP